MPGANDPCSHPIPAGARGLLRSTDMVLVALLLLALPGASLASTIVVPDETPSIQAALDLMPDTVLVRSGAYAESPTVLMDWTSPGGVVLMGIGPTAPELDGLRILIHHEQELIVVDGFHFKGLVRLDTGDEVTEWIAFRRCVFDAGFAETYSDIKDVSGLEFRDCRIRGDFAPFAEHSYTFADNVVEGTVRLRGMYLYGLDIRDNTFSAGPSPSPWIPGLWVDGDALSGMIQGNKITGFPKAMYVPYAEGLVISANRVEDAPDYGIRSGPITYSVTLVGNEIMRCGTGMVLEGGAAYVRGNVIGRSLRSGIEANLDYSGLDVRHNTIYLSGRSAIEITGPAGESAVAIEHNIGCGNGSYGLSGAPTGTSLSCNDWFGNAAGAVFPSGPGATDLDVDPLFCSLPDDSVHLVAASPLIDAPGCGLIGARGEGCNRTTAVATMPPAGGRFRLGPIAPQPAVRDVEIRFELSRAATVELVILDLQGRVIARLADGAHPAGEHRVRWPLGGDRGPATPGMYFARYRYPGGEQTRALIRLR